MSDKDELRDLLLNVVEKGEVILSSGKKSDFYIDARKITLDGRAAGIIGDLVVEKMKELGVHVVAGLSLGADPIVGSAAAVSRGKNWPVKGLLVRKEPKSHGKRMQIEGPDVKDGEQVLVVDDVATSGGSIIKASNVLRDEGFVVQNALVVVNRQEGADDALKEIGLDLFSLFTKEELL